MMGLWAWVPQHPRMTKWLTGGIAAVLLAGGVSLGVSRSATPQSERLAGPLDAQPVAVRIDASRHSVVGTVRAVGPSEILVRSQRGVFFAVRWSTGTQFRSAGRAIPPAALHAGDRVVVIGKPAADGSLVATFVTVVAAPAAKSAPTSTAPGSQ